jgi:hypothetical protein
MARAGPDITLFARGPHLAALRVRVINREGGFEARSKVIGSLEDAVPSTLSSST